MYFVTHSFFFYEIYTVTNQKHTPKKQQEYYDNVTFTKQAQELETILRTSFPKCKKFDIIGFSLGARLSLATIASSPTLIRKAHLTGVGLERSPFAKLVIHSWKDILLSSREGSSRRASASSSTSGDVDGGGHNSTITHTPSLRAFAWSIIMTTYSQEFLALNGADKVSLWVDHICRNNNHMGLLKLLEQTHGDAIEINATPLNNNSNRGDDDDYNLKLSLSSNNEMINIVEQIKRNNLNQGGRAITVGQIHMGEMDKISTIHQAQELSEYIGWNDIDNSDNGVITYKGCGHAVMNEDGRIWRRNVLDYLK